MPSTKARFNSEFLVSTGRLFRPDKIELTAEENVISKSTFNAKMYRQVAM